MKDNINHDNNNYNGDNNEVNALTLDDFYGIMHKRMEQYINTDGKRYYVIDNDSQKIRYICLSNAGFGAFSTDTEQIEWIEKSFKIDIISRHF